MKSKVDQLFTSGTHYWCLYLFIFQNLAMNSHTPCLKTNQEYIR